MMCDVFVGDTFGKLKVIAITANKTKRLMTLCECECGNFTEVRPCRLVQKHKPVKSCGCLRIEAVHNSKTTHGESGGLVVGKRTKLYRTWSNIKAAAIIRKFVAIMTMVRRESSCVTSGYIILSLFEIGLLQTDIQIVLL